MSFFFLFPFKDLFISSEPCIVVFQVVALCCQSFFIFHKLVQVTFPSLSWSSCFSLRSPQYDKSRIPLSGVSGPSIWALGGDREGLSPFQFLCVSVFFHQLVSRSSVCTQSSLLIALLGLMCYPYHLRKRYLVVFIICAGSFLCIFTHFFIWMSFPSYSSLLFFLYLLLFE